MNKILVTYRTTDVSHRQYAIVPTTWLSDLLRWLELSESAEVMGTTYNVDDDPIIPAGWPSYRACSDYVRILELAASGR